MKELCVVPCGSKKVWDKDPNAGPTKARDVYIGPFAGKCKEYAMKFYPTSWCILSAKYGFLSPDDIVPGPYNVSFNNKRTNPITTEELRIQAIQKGLDRYDQIIVLGGKNYTKITNEIFSLKKVYAPLNSCGGIGHMLGKLDEAIRKGTKI